MRRQISFPFPLFRDAGIATPVKGDRYQFICLASPKNRNAFATLKNHPIAENRINKQSAHVSPLCTTGSNASNDFFDNSTERKVVGADTNELARINWPIAQGRKQWRLHALLGALPPQIAQGRDF